MTNRELLTTCHDAGIVLAASGDRLHVEAPAGALTAELRLALVARKADLLPVLSRLEAMRATTGQAPVAVARPTARGGPGRCFSCGDALEVATAYGRCAPCDVAADIFYATSHGEDGRFQEF